MALVCRGVDPCLLFGVAQIQPGKYCTLSTLNPGNPLEPCRGACRPRWSTSRSSRARLALLSSILLRNPLGKTLQGRMSTALEYLALVPGEASADTAVLRDRIFRSGAPGVTDAAPAPPFPFISEEVPVLAQQPPAPAQPVQQQLQQQQPAAPSHVHGARRQ